MSRSDFNYTYHDWLDHLCWLEQQHAKFLSSEVRIALNSLDELKAANTGRTSDSECSFELTCAIVNHEASVSDWSNSTKCKISAVISDLTWSFLERKSDC